MTDSAVQIPGFIAGRWEIDPNHSEVAFTVGHLVISKVRGRFDAYSGTIETKEVLNNFSGERDNRRGLREHASCGPRQSGPFCRLSGC